MEAIGKVAERIENEGSVSDVAEKVSEYPKGEYLDRIVVKDRHKINIIPASDVRYIESMDDYVMIYTQNGHHMKQQTMKYFESTLDPKNFIRIHRSYIVKVDEINEIQQYEKESYIVILHDNTKLKVSKNGYKNLKDILNF
jgi:two-component system LytT family response regulator